jgi:hypothetical protein
MMDNITVPAIRTKLRTNAKVEHVEVTFTFTEEGERKVLSIIEGGVTGYEGFYIKDASIARMRIGGWTACMGTASRWDRLMVSAESMGKVFDHYGLK